MDTNPYSTIPELDAKAKENERRRRIAEAMMAKGLENQQPYTMAGGNVVPMQWTQGLAQIANAIVAKKNMKKADAAYAALAAQLTSGQQAVADSYMKNRTQLPEEQLPPRVKFDNGTAVVAPGPTLEGIGDTRMAALQAIGNPYASPQLRDQARLDLTLSEGDKNREDTQNFQRQNLLTSSLDRRAAVAQAMADREAARQLAAQTSRENAQTAAESRIQAAQIAAGARGEKPPAGIVAVDRKFGQEYADYVTGGAASTQQALDELHGAAKALETTQASGPILGALPQWLRKRVAGPGFKIQQDIERNVQSSLRQVLGAQYTQIEGENLLARTFDPSLKEDANLQRLNSLIGRLERAKVEKDRAVNYFRNNGTMAGYEGKTSWSAADFAPDVSSSKEPGALRHGGGSGQAGSTQVLNFDAEGNLIQ